MPLSIDPPDVYRNRIDSVVLEVNKNLDVRANSIKVVKGEPSTEPVAPTMKHEDGIDQYRLSDITVRAEATEIVESDIVNKVGMNETPFVQCPLKTVSIEDLFIQWDGEFNEWFSNIKAQLEGDVVTNLQRQIDANGDSIDELSENFVLEKEKNDARLYEENGIGSMFMVSSGYKNPITNALPCNGGSYNPDNYPELYNVLGTKYGIGFEFNNVAAEYGAKAEDPPIIMYNQEYDFFVGCDFNKGIVAIYRHGRSPVTYTIAGATAAGNNRPQSVIHGYTYGKLFRIEYEWHANGAYYAVAAYCDDVTEDTPTIAGSTITSVNANTLLFYGCLNTGSRSTRSTLDVGDHILFMSSRAGSIKYFKKSSKKTANIVDADLDTLCRSSTIGQMTQSAFFENVGTDGYVYYSSGRVLYRFLISDIETGSITVETCMTLDNTHGNFIGGFVCDDILCYSESSSPVKEYIVRGFGSNPQEVVFTTGSVVSYPDSYPYPIGWKIDDLIGVSPKLSTAAPIYIVKSDETISTSEQIQIFMYFAELSFSNGILTTVNNEIYKGMNKIKKAGLPNISINDAIVYIRAK